MNVTSFYVGILLSLAKEYAHTTFLLWLRIQFNEAVRENYIPSFKLMGNLSMQHQIKLPSKTSHHHVHIGSANEF